MTKQEIMEKLFSLENEGEFANADEATKKRYETLADFIGTLTKKSYDTGYEGAVAQAQYMTGFTDETAVSIFKSDGMPIPAIYTR